MKACKDCMKRHHFDARGNRYSRSTQEFAYKDDALSIGSNDYINNYLQPRLYSTSKRYPPKPFAQHLANMLKERLLRLYEIGARKVIVFEIGPVGCIPSITRKHKHQGQCVEEFNKLVTYFNDLLPTMLKNLTSTLQGSTFIHGRAHWIGYDAVTKQQNYGLVDSVNPCCKTWFNGTSGCIPFSSPCHNIKQHYFWDAFHLTEPVYSVIARHCFNGTDVCSPMNIKQLATI
uniref:GDSL esterase/lipase n=1 Tax=Kalanchoe fedtschenkoi TaxID=63787 RepID=A0A7N0T8J0_KALFE